jgi:predicted MFS family arabinose efflux permease
MLVGPKDLPNAIAMNSIQFNVARVVGPVLGGLALTELGAAWCFSLNGVSFIAVIISLAMLSARPGLATPSKTLLKSMREGIDFIRARPGLNPLIWLAFSMTLLGVPLIVFLPVVAKNVFQGGPSVYTLLLSVSGAGAIAGALAVAPFGHVERKGLIALQTLVSLGVFMAGFALSRNLVLSCILLFLAGGSLIATLAMISSLVQLIAPDEIRGRVMSVYNVAFRGGMPIGSFVTGSLVETLSAPPVLAANGLLLVLLGIYFLNVQRRVAEL